MKVFSVLLLLCFVAFASQSSYTCTDLGGVWTGEESDGSVQYNVHLSGGMTGTTTTVATLPAAENCKVTITAKYAAERTTGATVNNYTLTLTNVKCGGGSCADQICPLFGLGGSATQEVNFNPANCDQYYNQDGILLTRQSGSTSSPAGALHTTLASTVALIAAAVLLVAAS